MATDARGHTVPASTDRPRRQNLLDLSTSINAITTVANTTARAALVTAMTTAGLTPSTALPLLVYRTDAARLEMTIDGTNWTVIRAGADLTYTPVWGASTTNPTLGNGTIVGNYTQDDRYIDFEVTLTVGSTTTVGSGNYTLTLPVAALSASGRKMFNANLIDSSAGAIYSFVAQVIGGTAVMNLTNGGFPVGLLTAAAPVVPAVGDIYTVAGRYRWA